MAETTFKIAEAARMAAVSASTLRLWEAQGLISPIRAPSGQRLYEQSHIELLQTISWLRSEKGLNPAAIRDALAKEGKADGERKEPDPADGIPIGLKIRRLRQDAKMTLAAVSEAAGLSISLLSTFERTSTGLSVTALHGLASYFGTTVAALSGQEQGERESLVREGEWRSLPTTSSGVTVQILAEGNTQMECHRFLLAPGASSEGAYRHAGEEFIHVLSGSIEIVLDGDQFAELRPGDSFYFESGRSHSWRNSFEGETVVIWVNTPPTF